MTTFLYLNGLKKLAKTLKGSENIHIGIRPFGFHAGNKLALLIYPYLLCEELQKLEKNPEFNCFISLNDFEPNELAYLEKGKTGFFYRKISDYKLSEEPTYESNIFCEETNIGSIPDPYNCCDSVVSHYEKIIKNEAKELFSARFPKVRFNFIRNSELLKEKVFQKYLLFTLKHSDKIAEIIAKNTGQKMLVNMVQYAGAICPVCNKSNGETLVLKGNNIQFNCKNCGKETVGSLTNFLYWIYHKPLLIPRLLIFGIDLCIRGGDHYQSGSVDVNSALLNELEPNFIIPKTLITPVVVDNFGHKLSKSYGNTVDLPSDKIINYARKSTAGTFVVNNIVSTKKRGSVVCVE